MKKKVRQVLGGLAVFGILVLLGAAGMGIAHKALERQTERLMSTTVTVADPSGNRLLQTAKNPGGTDPVSSADPGGRDRQRKSCRSLRFGRLGGFGKRRSHSHGWKFGKRHGSG